MSDEWGRDLFVASYGGLDLHLEDTDDDVSRVTANYEYQHRDGGHVDDQGAAIRQTSMNLVFAAGLEPDHIAHLVAFLNLCHDGEAHELVHPITGTYMARPGPIRFSATAQVRDEVRLSVTFFEHEPDPAAFESGQGVPTLAGVAEVEAAQLALDAELATLGASSTAGTDALDVAETWDADDGTLTQREINLELNRVANAIDDEIDRLELLTDIDRQPALEGFLRLRNALARAAEKVIASGPTLIRYEVRAAMPLLAVVQEIYGGADGELRAQQLLDLNDIRDPTRIDAGTVLTAQSPDRRVALGAR